MEDQEHNIYTSKYLLQIKYLSEENIIEMHWTSKMNNTFVRQMIGTLPAELMKENLEELWRKVRSYRRLYI